MKNIFNGKTFLIVAVVAIAASIVYANYAANSANEGITFEAHIKGNPDAPVVLTEYADFQCPACGQFQPVVKDLLDTYGDQLAIEFKHFPLITIHPFAVPAARAAEAAGQQGKFWEMHDKLFENQQVWSRSGSPQVFFRQYAEEIGLDIDLYNRHYGASLIKDKIEAGYSEARELGLTGTPSFFLNGERMQFETFEEFESAINIAVNGESVDTESTEEGGEAAAPTQPDVRFGF